MKKGKLLPKSFGIISSCIKTVSSNASSAVRSIAESISSSENDKKEQVLWVGFDKLELSPTAFKRVLLLGYIKGFQVFNVEDASGLSELVSRRDGPVTFLQILPAPFNRDGAEKHQLLHPILVAIVGDDDDGTTVFQNSRQGPERYGSLELSFNKTFEPPTAVRFYSMTSNDYVKIIDFKSAVLMVRCSSLVVAIGLEEQIYCFDTATLEKKIAITTYPVPRFVDQGAFGINGWYGPVAAGPRWLAYPPRRPFLLNTGRVSPQSLASSVSPPSSPGTGSLARCAVNSSKHLAVGIFSLGDMGYKKLAKYGSDGSNSPGWKSASESENAGWIAVKDLVSSEIISQFRAHSSPISALCFDPSGTLLVTASVRGYNVNIFRIMPTSSCSGSGRNADWSNSHVHLYKLHRGMTTAVIQDICFSQYSQWIAVVSSRGTCHIFTISPFGVGGDGGLQAVSTHGQSAPWWASPSFATNEQKFAAPLPCSPSEVTCIKFSDTGLLNSVTNAAASVAGKTWVPSGAVAATFHNTNCIGSLNVNSTVRPLVHILVYTPSGFVVQHEIQSCGLEWNENITESWSASQVNERNVELKVKVEPTQWWDVCRRLNNLHNDLEIDENVDIEEKKLVKSESLKSPGKKWHLSNAEVQINSCRVPLWQNSKMQFCVMEPPKEEWLNGGEFEIEKTPSHEIETRQKNLFPALHFTSAGSDLTNRSDGSQTREKTNETSVVCHSEHPSFSSTESSEGGSSRRIENLMDTDHLNIGSYKTPPDERSRPIVPLTAQPNCYAIPPLEVKNTDMATENIHMPSNTEKTVDFGNLFDEGYCGEPEMHDRPNSTEVVTDEVDTHVNDQEEIPDDEGWAGGMFDLYEEG